MKNVWNGGQLPRNQWIGMKVITRNIDGGQHVKMEIRRDLSDGVNGGQWEKIHEYTDDGGWSVSPPPRLRPAASPRTTSSPSRHPGSCSATMTSRSSGTRRSRSARSSRSARRPVLPSPKPRGPEVRGASSSRATSSGSRPAGPRSRPPCSTAASSRCPRARRCGSARRTAPAGRTGLDPRDLARIGDDGVLEARLPALRRPEQSRLRIGSRFTTWNCTSWMWMGWASSVKLWISQISMESRPGSR